MDAGPSQDADIHSCDETKDPQVSATQEWAALSPPPVEVACPRKVSRFEIRERLGSGGFGSVYLAYDPTLDREVAVKIPRESKVWSDHEIEKFLNEARIAARFKHSNCITVYDAGRCPDNGVFITMEYVPGETLTQRLRQGRLTVEEAVRICGEVASVIQEGSALGLYHRDLKPANILLDRNGHVKVCDFGLAVHEDALRSHQGEISGTWAYMSPEQIRGEVQALDGRSDIWSLGVILYECLSGRRPFRSKDLPDLRDEILNSDPKPLRQIDATIPPALDDLCQKCLQRTIGNRLNSAADFREALAKLGAKKPRGKNIIIAVVIAGIILLAAYPLLFLQPSIKPQPPSKTDLPDGHESRLWQDVPRSAPEIPYTDAEATPAVWNPGRHEVSVQATRIALFKLGEIERLPCRIRLKLSDLKPEHPAFEAGLFLGLRNVELEDKSQGMRYQCMSLAPETGADTWQVTRQNMQLRWLDLGAQIRFPAHGSRGLPTAQPGIAIPNPVALSLVLDQDGLQTLECNFQGMHRLSSPEINDLTTEADYLGTFGIFVQGGSLTVRDAQIKYDLP